METKVVITIDTEVKYPLIEDPFDRDVAGNVPGISYGAYWIADLLQKHGFRGVFFLDVCGSSKYGADRYRVLCSRLLAASHTIELHTHPDQMYDPKRRHMHEYSLADQETMIRDGMALLKDWTGKVPTAHRAGRYGANEDTLKALRANGIDLDSSFFYGRANCKLPFGNTNAPFQAHGVWEIPVTMAAQSIEKRGFRFPGWTRRFWKRYQKLDVNCMTAKEICRSINELSGHIPYIIIFLHSFSFIRRDPSGFVPDERALESFRAMLRLLTEKKMSVITCDEILTELAVE
jgi:peptidoglycan/xylan/chitin deacetylase (PgdA/CDA1 family)